MSILDVRKQNKPSAIIWDDSGDCLEIGSFNCVSLVKQDRTNQGNVDNITLCSKQDIDDLILALRKAKEVWYS